MKRIIRYKCDFCNKIAAKPQTILRHEKECTNNPESRNCYICKNSCLGGWDEYTFKPWEAYCRIHDDFLNSLRRQNFTALNCEDFVRTEEMFTKRLHEDTARWDYDTI